MNNEKGIDFWLKPPTMVNVAHIAYIMFDVVSIGAAAGRSRRQTQGAGPLLRSQPVLGQFSVQNWSSTYENCLVIVNNQFESAHPTST